MKREAAAVKRDTRMKAWKEKKQAAEKKKKGEGCKGETEGEREGNGQGAEENNCLDE